MVLETTWQRLDLVLVVAQATCIDMKAKGRGAGGAF
jgi:hypothetical protein